MLTLEFIEDKETKNARRFQEVTDRARGIVGSIYVLKDELDKLGYEVGAALKVTLNVNGAKPAGRKAATRRHSR